MSIGRNLRKLQEKTQRIFRKSNEGAARFFGKVGQGIKTAVNSAAARQIADAFGVGNILEKVKSLANNKNPARALLRAGTNALKGEIIANAPAIKSMIQTKTAGMTPASFI